MNNGCFVLFMHRYGTRLSIHTCGARSSTEYIFALFCCVLFSLSFVANAEVDGDDLPSCADLDEEANKLIILHPF